MSQILTQLATHCDVIVMNLHMCRCDCYGVMAPSRDAINDVIVMNLPTCHCHCYGAAAAPPFSRSRTTIDTEKHPNMATAITIAAIDAIDIDIVLLLQLLLFHRPIEFIRKKCNRCNQPIPAKALLVFRKIFLYLYFCISVLLIRKKCNGASSQSQAKHYCFSGN